MELTSPAAVVVVVAIAAAVSVVVIAAAVGAEVGTVGAALDHVLHSEPSPFAAQNGQSGTHYAPSVVAAAVFVFVVEVTPQAIFWEINVVEIAEHVAAERVAPAVRVVGGVRAAGWPVAVQPGNVPNGVGPPSSVP